MLQFMAGVGAGSGRVDDFVLAIHLCWTGKADVVRLGGRLPFVFHRIVLSIFGIERDATPKRKRRCF